MVQSNFDYDFELFNLHSFCRLAQNQRKPMAFSLRKTSYVVSACVVGIQFISPLFPDGSVSALGWTLGLAIIPLILGIA
ncbi:hypothetical protein, partial [Corynebacterium propinquum]